MGFARKHGFKVAVLALCAAMGLYLYLSNSKAASPKLDKLITAPNFQFTDLDSKQVRLMIRRGRSESFISSTRIARIFVRQRLI